MSMFKLLVSGFAIGWTLLVAIDLAIGYPVPSLNWAIAVVVDTATLISFIRYLVLK